LSEADKASIEKLKEELKEIGELQKEFKAVPESIKKAGILERIKGKLKGIVGKVCKGGWVGSAVILYTFGSMAMETYASASGKDMAAIKKDIDAMLRGEGGMELAASMALSAGANSVQSTEESKWLKTILGEILQKYSLEKQEEFYKIAQEIKEEVQTTAAREENLQRQIKAQLSSKIKAMEKERLETILKSSSGVNDLNTLR
jgi:hypothetical protein